MGVFSHFFHNLWLPHTFKVWTASKSLEIDQDNLQMIFSALNVDCNTASFDPLGSGTPPYEHIKFGYPFENVRFLLLSTNLAWERLQIDKDLLPIITSTADKLLVGTNIDDLERPWTPKIWVYMWFFCYFRLRRTLRVNFRRNILEIDRDNLRTKLNWCCRTSHEHLLKFLVFKCSDSQ